MATSRSAKPADGRTGQAGLTPAVPHLRPIEPGAEHAGTQGQDVTGTQDHTVLLRRFLQHVDVDAGRAGIDLALARRRAVPPET